MDGVGGGGQTVQGGGSENTQREVTDQWTLI